MSNRLSGLTDRQLIAELQKLRGSERENTLEILRHLNEVERRKLHLKLGYSSLFVYCTEHLCYAESTAGRRVQAARCLSRFPQIEGLLLAGEINLVTLGLVANLLTPQNVDWFLERIRNKRQREVEAIAAAFRPATYLRDRVLRVSVPAPVTPLSSATTAALPLGSSTSGDAAAASATPGTDAASGALPGESPGASSAEQQSTGGASGATSAEPQSPGGASPGPLLVNVGSNSHYGSEKRPIPLPTIPKLYIQFLADEDFMRDYNQACALLSNRLRRVTFSSVFSAVLRDYLERHSPQRRQERREAKQIARDTPRIEDSPIVDPREGPRRPPISPQVRDAVFLRDQGRCTYVGADGRRCGETLALNVDHIQPIARDGSGKLENLRLLCSQHNQLEAQRVFGERAIKKHIERKATLQEPKGDP